MKISGRHQINLGRQVPCHLGTSGHHETLVQGSDVARA